MIGNIGQERILPFDEALELKAIQILSDRVAELGFELPAPVQGGDYRRLLANRIWMIEELRREIAEHQQQFRAEGIDFPERGVNETEGDYWIVLLHLRRQHQLIRHYQNELRAIDVEPLAPPAQLRDRAAVDAYADLLEQQLHQQRARRQARQEPFILVRIIANLCGRVFN